jgi:hypothetical protein
VVGKCSHDKQPLSIDGKWERGKDGSKFRVMEDVETGGQELSAIETLAVISLNVKTPHIS